MILSAVKIACTLDWMVVQVAPHTYTGHRHIFPDELYLGSGCPVTRIQPYVYDFTYPVSDCGIRMQVRIVITYK